MKARWIAGGALVLLAGGVGPVHGRPAGLGMGEEPPSLYELTARSDLVVAARVMTGTLKRAEVEVVEVFRGSAQEGQRLEIAFRDFNDLLPKEDRVLFQEGETDVLFLVPERGADGRPKREDRFTLARGRFGKYTLPREGNEIYFEAMREFSRLVAEKDHRLLYQEIRNLLSRANPILVDIGLHEVERLDLMEPGLLERVLDFLNDPAPRRRSRALRLVGRLFQSTPPERRPPEWEEQAMPAMVALVRNDPDESVRVEAVEALGRWGGADSWTTLKEVAAQDPAQAVRYHAEVLLLKQRGRGTSRTPPSP